MSCHNWIACLVSAGLAAGCSPAAPPPTPPATAHARHDHDHDDHDDHDEHDDHDHDHDHDHGKDDHDEPETVAAGIAELEKLCADVKTHLAAGLHDKADGAVHMVGHLLEDIGELVSKEKPAAAAEAKQALDAVFDCFDRFDTALHAADEEARRKLDYAEHAPAIEAAVAKLKGLFPAAPTGDR